MINYLLFWCLPVAILVAIMIYNYGSLKGDDILIAAFIIFVMGPFGIAFFAWAWIADHYKGLWQKFYTHTFWERKNNDRR